MGVFDLDKSIKKAELRFGSSTRRVRSDRGVSRLDPRLQAELRRGLQGLERPDLDDLARTLQDLAARHHLKAPSRATIYAFIPRCPPHTYVVEDLPAHVRDALYNLDKTATVPGHQLAFYAFQYGDLRAASFAAGLPWLDLYQADRLRGWRTRSHGLLRAALRRRAIG